MGNKGQLTRLCEGGGDRGGGDREEGWEEDIELERMEGKGREMRRK